MFLITVAFGASVCPLLYRTEENARAALSRLGLLQGVVAPKNLEQADTTGAMCFEGGVGMSLEQMRGTPVVGVIAETSDDFGRVLWIDTTKLTGVIFEDLDASKEGQIEQALHQARMQADANKRGQNDPKLQASQRLQTPSFSPGMNGSGRMF